MSTSKLKASFLAILLLSGQCLAKHHLRDDYTIEEILQVDFPDFRRILSKAEVLDYLLRRFVHSNLQQARVFHFKFQIRQQKAEYYTHMNQNDSLPEDFEQTMKRQTLEVVEGDTNQGDHH